MHITSRVPGEKYPNLLQEKGFRGFPSLAFMDPDGNIIVKGFGRSVAAFRQAVAANRDKLFRWKPQRPAGPKKLDIPIESLPRKLGAMHKTLSRGDYKRGATQLRKVIGDEESTDAEKAGAQKLLDWVADLAKSRFAAVEEADKTGDVYAASVKLAAFEKAFGPMENFVKKVEALKKRYGTPKVRNEIRAGKELQRILDKLDKNRRLAKGKLERFLRKYADSFYAKSARAALNELTGAPNSDPSASKVVYTCPMHPEVKTSSPGRCPKCGMNLRKVSSSGPSAAAAVYTCPMHPEVKNNSPGRCPKCGMNLVKR